MDYLLRRSYKRENTGTIAVFPGMAGQHAKGQEKDYSFKSLPSLKQGEERNDVLKQHTNIEKEAEIPTGEVAGLWSLLKMEDELHTCLCLFINNLGINLRSIHFNIE